MSPATKAVVVGGVVLVVFGLVWLLLQRPVSHEERVIFAFDASSPPVVIEPTHRFEQRFTAPEQPLHGVAIYLPARYAPVLARLAVRNPRTGDSVAGYLAETAVRGDSQRLIFLLPHLPSAPKDTFIASITNTSPTPLPLLTHTPGTITLSAISPVQTAPGFYEGVLAAGIFIFLILLTEILAILPRWRWWLVRLVVVILPLFAVSGLWYSLGELGIGDWDYRFSLHEIYRRTIMDFYQFPLWNPYTCGGTAALADPEFSVFSPTFLLELLFGIGGGTKAGIYLGLVILGLGMVQLAKALGLSWRGAALAALIASYGSAYILKVVEGHVTITYAFMWVPWIFWSWLGAYRSHSSLVSPFSPRLRPADSHIKVSRSSTTISESKGRRLWGSKGGLTSLYQLVGGLFFALAFYQGGVYVLSYTVVALAVLGMLVKNRRAALMTTFWLVVWGVGLSGVKLLPVLYWLSHYPDAHYVPSTATFPYLFDIFLRRHPHGSYLLPGQLSGWHEYGAYVGYFVFGLCVLALAAWRHRLVRALVLGALLAVLTASLGPFLQHSFDYIPFIPRSNISRLNLFAVIPISLLAAVGLEVFYRKTIWRRTLTLLVMLLVAVDLLSFSATLSHQAFILPAVFPAPSPAPWPLAYTDEDYSVRRSGHENPRSYAATLAGYGNFSFCSVLGPAPKVAKVTPETTPPLTTVGYNGSATVELWSPLSFTVRVMAPRPTQAVVNMNYAPGWRANGEPAINYEGRLGADVEAGESIIVFSYRVPGLIFGLLVTVGTLGAAGYVLHRRKRYVS